MELVGFHGTSPGVAETILAEGFKPSSEKQWLGKGVYFFEGHPDLLDGRYEAECFVKYARRWQKWEVLRAIIRSGKGLDLVGNEQHKQHFEEAMKAAIDKHLKTGRTVDQFQDYVIFKLIDDGGSDLDYIRAFTEGRKEYQGYRSKVVRRLQIQLCVKNVDCIGDIAAADIEAAMEREFGDGHGDQDAS